MLYYWTQLCRSRTDNERYTERWGRQKEGVRRMDNGLKGWCIDMSWRRERGDVREGLYERGKERERDRHTDRGNVLERERGGV